MSGLDEASKPRRQGRVRRQLALVSSVAVSTSLLVGVEVVGGVTTLSAPHIPPTGTHVPSPMLEPNAPVIVPRDPAWAPGSDEDAAVDPRRPDSPAAVGQGPVEFDGGLLPPDAVGPESVFVPAGKPKSADRDPKQSQKDDDVEVGEGKRDRAGQNGRDRDEKHGREESGQREGPREESKRHKDVHGLVSDIVEKLRSKSGDRQWRKPLQRPGDDDAPAQSNAKRDNTQDEKIRKGPKRHSLLDAPMRLREKQDLRTQSQERRQPLVSPPPAEEGPESSMDYPRPGALKPRPLMEKPQAAEQVPAPQPPAEKPQPPAKQPQAAQPPAPQAPEAAEHPQPTQQQQAQSQPPKQQTEPPQSAQPQAPVEQHVQPDGEGNGAQPPADSPEQSGDESDIGQGF